MAREEKRPSGGRSFGSKPTSSASGRSNSGSGKSFSKFKKDDSAGARPRRTSGSGSSEGSKSYRGAGDFKKSFGEKPAFGRKPFGDKPSGDFKPKRSFGSRDNEGGEKRSFGRSFGDNDSRPKREGGDSKPRFGDKKTFGDKPKFGGSGKSFGRKPFGDKPSGDFKPKRSFGNRDNEGSEKRSFGRSFDDNDSRPRREDGDSKPRFGDKPSFGRKPYGDKPSGDFKPKRSFGSRNNEGGERRSFGKSSDGGDSRPRKTVGFKSVNDDFSFEKSQKRDDDFIASDFEKAARYADDEPKADKKRSTKQPAFTESVSDSKEGIRLNKYIANSGICSRREADVLIAQGLVTVNGAPVTELGVIVKRNDIVKYDGRTLNPEKNVYLLLNKPKDFITTTNDPQERRTVMNLVASACKERIYPVGRLDRNTTGLLLFTNDGELAEKLTHPSHQIKKIYQVELDRPISPEDSQAILDGLYFEEGKAVVDSMAVLDESRRVVGIEIHIGWNRIVRRVFEAKGYDVVRLDRVLYAGLTKKDLPRGDWRFLTEKEIIALKYPQK